MAMTCENFFWGQPPAMVRACEEGGGRKKEILGAKKKKKEILGAKTHASLTAFPCC